MMMMIADCSKESSSPSPSSSTAVGNRSISDGSAGISSKSHGVKIVPASSSVSSTPLFATIVVIVGSLATILIRLLLHFCSASSSKTGTLAEIMSSKRLCSSLVLLILFTNNFAMAACNIKTVADPPWSSSDMASLKTFPVTAGGAGKPHEGSTSSSVSISPVIAASGYPTAALSPHSVSRQKLLQLISNPAFKRPNMDDLPVHVMIKLIPIKIQDLIEKNEVLETTLRLQLTWQDKRLSWSSDIFHNITEIVIPGNLIWVPDIAILNSVSDLYHVVRDTRFEMKLENNGRVWWHPTGIVKTNCKLSLRYFPFDKQMCKFIFESPTFDLRFMNLTLRSEKSPVDTRMYTDGETWQLLGFSGRNIINQVGSKTFFARVEFMIRIERAKIYHLLNVILPAIFLSTVQVMFFLLPATHPQRVGSSTTTLLSVVVFQTVAVSQLPKTSTETPLLSIYIFFVIIVSALSVGTSIIVAKFVVYADKRVPIPNWVMSIPHPTYLFRTCICYLCCCCRRFSSKRTAANLAPQTNNNGNNSSRHRINNDRATSSTGQVRVSVASSPLIQSPNGCYSTNIEVDKPVDFRLKMSDSMSNSAEGPSRAGSSHGHEPSHYLFTSWADISYFIDIILMTVALSIAVLSPVALFIIMPSMSADIHLMDSSH